MRKLIMIAAIALMSTSSCYANLSLADASQPTTVQTVAHKSEPKPVAEEKSAPAARPHRRHAFSEARLSYLPTEHCW